MKNIKFIGLALVLLFSSGLIAQCKEKVKKTDSEIVMTKAELESFLAKVAELRKQKLRSQKELRNKKDLAELRNKYNSTHRYNYGRDIGTQDLYMELDRLNWKIDRLAYGGYHSNGRDNSTIIMPRRENSGYVYDGGAKANTTNTENDKAIWELERKLDSLKSIQGDSKELASLKSQFDALESKFKSKTEPTVLIKEQERRSMLEELLYKFKNFKKQIFFNNNSAKLNTGDLRYLVDVANVLKEHNELSVVLEGWASTRGNSQYNKQLSMKRSEAVKAALLDNGISSNKIISSFQGEDKKSSEEHARRVDISVVLK